MTLIGTDDTCPTCNRRVFGDMAEHLREHARQNLETFKSSYDSPEMKARMVKQLRGRPTERRALAELLGSDREMISDFIAHLTGEDTATWARLMAKKEFDNA
jgi:hypothetical protein